MPRISGPDRRDRNTDSLAMNRTSRPRCTAASPTNMKSRKLLWFAATTTGPSAGRCSTPDTLIRSPKARKSARQSAMTTR